MDLQPGRSVGAAHGRGDATIPTINGLVREQARRTPAAIAVVAPDGELAYSELVRRAEALASRLAGLGERAEAGSAIVGVCVERSLALPVGLLGILESGAAYLPLDPAYPEQRLARMLADSGAEAVVCTARTEARVRAAGVRCVRVDDSSTVSSAPARTATDPGAPRPAYVIYTSGSTGEPKGVVVAHAGLVNHARAMADVYGLTSTDRVLQFASISFDVAAEELFPTWIRGGAVVLRDEAVSGNFAAFRRFLAEHEVTVVNLPTPFWQEWTLELARTKAELPPALRLVITGSERVLPARLALWKQTFGERVRWLNAYGPTETTISATVWEPPAGPLDQETLAAASVPIGSAIAGVRTYVLDGELRPVKAGELGELFIGGAGVALGYLNRPELTVERFLDDPFAPGARMYKTGDLARVRPPGVNGGAIEFHGRSDEQVKLRGYRIELGEIEAVLADHPSVREAAVLLREDAPGVSRLVGYVAAPGAKPELERELIARLAERLPEYMRPSELVRLEALPRLPGGKVDRRALVATRATGPRAGYVAPQGDLEQRLCALWERLLGVKPVGRDDDFFALGGHSLLGTQMLALVDEEFGVELPLLAVFESKTPAALAARIASAGRAPRHELPPFEHVDRNAPLFVSCSQEPIWYLLQLEPGLLAYNTQFSIRFKGTLDADALWRALDEIIRRHEIFRTTFEGVGGSPVQRIHAPYPVERKSVDLTRTPAAEREAKGDALANELCLRSFDITQLPLVEWTLVKYGERDHELVQVEHHFVHDGWSIALLLGEIRNLYAAYAHGKTSPLPELEFQFADYAAWQRKLVDGPRGKELIAFWKEALAGAPPLLELPTDRPRPRLQTFVGSSQVLTIEPALYARLKALAQREGFTLFQVMLAAFHTLLHRYSGQTDLVIATAAANRRAKEAQKIIGMMVNAVPLRADASGDPTFREFATRVRASALAAWAHQELPFERVVESVAPERDFSHNPLFQVMFSFHDSPVPDLEVDDLVGRMVYRYNGSAKFDMNLVVIPRGEQRIGRSGKPEDEHVIVEWEYNTDLFDGERIARMLGHFKTLLESVTEGFDRPLSELEMLTASERQVLLETWNDTHVDASGPATLPEMFRAQAQRTPDAVALACGDTELSYRELANRSAALAAELVRRGVGPGVIVGVCLERSPELVVALLAVLEAGGAYLPLDPAFPRERLAYIVGDASTRLLLTQSSLLAGLPEHGAERILLDRERFTTPTTLPKPRARPGDLAYVIYTSGSTGKPKGVQIEHRALANFLRGIQAVIGLAPSDVLAAVTTISFDIAGLELYAPLTVGARVVLVDHETSADGQALAALLERTHATAMQATPATWRLLLAANWSGGARFRALCGGEALPLELARKLRPRCGALFNLYGPTETTIWSSVARIEEQDETITIGHPLANTDLYVLGPRRELLPVGVPGELAIGGTGLARGYLNRPELTAEKFVPCPFTTGGAGEKARMYMTGDLVRRLPDGRIEFVRRLDKQIKLRGFRIELGEIEVALVAHADVEKAVVLSRGKGAEQRLVAWFVPRNGRAVEPLALREHLRSTLPEYMLPGAFVALEKFPLTPNGKVDERALPDPDRSAAAAEAFVAPTTPSEKAVAAAFGQALELDRVGLRDNFFDLGGHSLLAMRVLVRLEGELGVKIFPRDLMLQNVGQLAALCDARRSAPQAASAQESRSAGLLQRVARNLKGFVSRDNDGAGPSR